MCRNGASPDGRELPDQNEAPGPLLVEEFAAGAPEVEVLIAGVLDSSALLCVLNGEAGAKCVAAVLPMAVVGAVNLAEIVTKLREKGLSAEEADEVLGGRNLDVQPLIVAQATATGHLRPVTRALGLSLATARAWRLRRSSSSSLLPNRLSDGSVKRPTISWNGNHGAVAHRPVLKADQFAVQERLSKCGGGN